MDPAEQIKEFHEFIGDNYKAKLIDRVRKGHNNLKIDF